MVVSLKIQVGAKVIYDPPHQVRNQRVSDFFGPSCLTREYTLNVCNLNGVDRSNSEVDIHLCMIAIAISFIDRKFRFILHKFRFHIRFNHIMGIVALYYTVDY